MKWNFEAVLGGCVAVVVVTVGLLVWALSGDVGTLGQTPRSSQAAEEQLLTDETPTPGDVYTQPGANTDSGADQAVPDSGTGTGTGTGTDGGSGNVPPADGATPGVVDGGGAGTTAPSTPAMTPVAEVAETPAPAPDPAPAPEPAPGFAVGEHCWDYGPRHNWPMDSATGYCPPLPPAPSYPPLVLPACVYNEPQVTCYHTDAHEEYLGFSTYNGTYVMIDGVQYRAVG